ncbi:regulatory protein GemA [Candidatus Ferrigenium straubiae]|uniref:regulatory protein GemA n=1 Tax=Candidatus Ferrigenium straubiae TaxID=2919506 RepID=UPI003F4ABB84
MTKLIKHYRQLVGIAKGWAMANLPGWSDDSHRDLLQRHGAVEIEGRISASSMNVPQLGAVLEDYERRGWPRNKRVFNPASTGSGRTEKRSVPPRIAFVVRLWGKLGKAGKVQHADRRALLAFCARQVGHDVPDLDSLSVDECQRITEAMKGWLGR